jgi:ribosomal protein S18 acetylase RimI-like enzyme
MPTIMKIRPFQIEDQAAVIELWRRCGLVRPQNDPVKDIRRKLKVQPELFLIGIKDDKIVASAMCSYDGHRAWVNYFGVDPDSQRGGMGRAMMAEIERLVKARGCPKINLQVRGTNLAATEFYKSVGFGVDEVVSMGKRLEFD